MPFEEQLRCYAKAAPGVQFYAETKAPAEYGGRMEPALIKLLDRLDLVPKGRDEDALPFTMSWVKRHDEYEQPVIDGKSCCGWK